MKKLILSLPDDFLKALDGYARVQHTNRTTLLREAVRRYLAGLQSASALRPAIDPEVLEACRIQDAIREKLKKSHVKNTTETIRHFRGPLKP